IWLIIKMANISQYMKLYAKFVANKPNLSNHLNSKTYKIHKFLVEIDNTSNKINLNHNTIYIFAIDKGSNRTSIFLDKIKDCLCNFIKNQKMKIYIIFYSYVEEEPAKKVPSTNVMQFDE